MPEKYVKWMNFWENLTLLDSSHLEVFLEFFWKFFIFLNLNLNFEFLTGFIPEPARTGLTGNRSNRTGSQRFCEPWMRDKGREFHQRGLMLDRPAGARPGRRAPVASWSAASKIGISGRPVYVLNSIEMERCVQHPMEKYPETRHVAPSASQVGAVTP